MGAELLLLFQSLGAATPIPTGETIDDTITLGGQVFPIMGASQGNAISEFESGIKVGRVTYDQRENAFFLVLDDFSGGFGSRRLDIREELGTFWESDEDSSPDLRRPGHMTLGMAKELLTPTAPTANTMGVKPTSYPLMAKRTGSPKFWLLGFGNSIYSSTGGAEWTQRHTAGVDAEGVGSILEFNAWDGGQSSRKFFAFFHAETLSGGARYVTSTTGTTWANGASNRVIEDGIVWDKKLLGAYDNTIMFATYDGNGTATEQWNVDDANDGEAITSLPGGRIRFIGVAEAPWGEPAVYFTNGFNIYVLDFFRRTQHQINVGVDRPILAACMWNGEVTWTDGWNVMAYSPGSMTVRNIGFPRSNILPPSLRSTGTNIYLITSLLSSDDYLYATVASEVDNKTRLFCYNSLGWSQVGESMPIYSEFVGQCSFPPHIMRPAARKLIVVGADNADSLNMRVYNFNLPTLHHVPSVGSDDFAASGASWITGWIDGGFNDINGTLLRLNIDAFNLSTTSKVGVEYQLDNDESSVWTSMVDVNAAADYFDSTTSVLYFSATVPKRGVEFRTVRFRITLYRGDTATDSPEVRALTMVYTKEPQLRTAWTFTIDVNRMIEESATGSATTFYVDGVAATFANVWAKLRSLWNEHSLLSLVIPNVEPNGINVKITDMPVTFDDFRNAITGKGGIQIQVLEPVV